MSTPSMAEPLPPDTTPRPRFSASTGLTVALLFGVTLAFYQNLWWPGLVLIRRDAFRFFLPIKQYLAERLAAGELPQWFPYEALGRPFIGVAHTGVFHPFTALYLLFPAHDAYRASTLLSCLLATLGAFVLGRALKYTRTGALVAGFAFAFSGYVVSLTEHITYLYSICALPIFCAGLEKALREHQGWVVAPALVWASVFLNGDIQTGYYFGFIALAWMAARAPAAYWPAALRLALVLVLTVMLAAVQLGPSWAVYSGSDRTEPTAFHEQALSWSTHPLRLITLLLSPVSENADPVALARFFFGSPKFGVWSESLYLGLPMVVLALLGAWHRRDLRMFTFLSVVAVFLSLGRYGGLYEVFYRLVPLWSVFRYPEKIMGIASFSIAMLAGAGVDSVRNGKTRPVPWLVAAALCAGAWLGLHTEAAGAWVIAHFGAPAPLTGEVIRSSSLALVWSGIEAGGLGLAVLAMRRRWIPMAALLATLAMIVVLDLARVNHSVYRTGPAEIATFTPAFAEAISAREGMLAPGRFRMLSLRNPTYVSPKSLRRLLGHDADIVERRQALDLEHNVQFHLETVFDYMPGSSIAYSTILGQYPGTAVAARFNVAYYIGRTAQLSDARQAPHLIAVLRDYDLALFANPDPAKPRAYLARHPERAAAPIDPAALIARPDFLNGAVDVLETSGGPLPENADAGTASIEHYAPEEVLVKVEASRTAVLVLLDAYDQGWTAALENGADLPILRANALVRAVVVPAGAHVVSFSYRTPLLKAGALTSVAGVFLCLGLIVHARRRSAGSRPIDTPALCGYRKSMFQSRLDDLARRALLRRLRTIDSAPGAEVDMDGRRILLFSSNNYLDLASHPTVVEAAITAIRRYGVGAGASRLVSGSLRPHRELEERLAAFKRVEAALVFSTGYQANLGLIPTLAENRAVIYADRLCHASLIDACRLCGASLRVYRHRDHAHLARLLHRGGPPRPALVITDGVFSMDGDLAPLPELCKAAEHADAMVVVDDAHGTGVMGKEGRGTVEHFGLQGRPIVQMGTLSKALGGMGGFVAGPRDLIAYLVNRARPFIYTTALPPALAAAASAALDVIAAEPERRARLWSLRHRLHEGVRQIGFDTLDSQSPIIPLLVGDADQALSLSEQLLAQGVYAPAIRPPTVPDGTSRIRMSVTAGHRPEQIDHVLEALRTIVAADERVRESLRGGRLDGAKTKGRRARSPSP